jgi:FkbM family methyltransferase
MQPARSQPSRYLYAIVLFLTGLLLIWLFFPSSPDTLPQVLLETFSRLEYVEQRVRKLEQQLAKCACHRRRSHVAKAALPSSSSRVAVDFPVPPEPIDVSGPVVSWDGKSVLIARGLTCERKELLSFALCLDTMDLKHDLIARTGHLSDCDGALQLVQGRSPSSSGLFLDVGSNTGICSMVLLSAGWKVVAFEPSPRNLFFLSKSALLNPELNRNFTLYPLALGAESAAVPLFTERSNLANSVLGFPTRADPKNPVNVRVAPLDDVLWPDPLSAAPLIAGMKVDVRGYEVNVLRGAKRLLGARVIKSMVISVATEWLRNSKSSPSELCLELMRQGFDLFEDVCAGEGVILKERGSVVDVERCRHWDETNAECSITARLRLKE